MIGEFLKIFLIILIHYGDHLHAIVLQMLKTKKFLYFTPDTSGVDAFAYDWSTHNNWLVPPVYLVSKCINHMRLYKS